MVAHARQHGRPAGDASPRPQVALEKGADDEDDRDRGCQVFRRKVLPHTEPPLGVYDGRLGADQVGEGGLQVGPLNGDAPVEGDTLRVRAQAGVRGPVGPLRRRLAPH